MPFLQVRIDRITPDVVTTTSEQVVTVSGTVANVGDRPVRDIVARLEHAAAVDLVGRTAHRSRRQTSTSSSPSPSSPTSSPELQRGQDAGFTFVLSAAIGDRAAALGIDKPGVYPLLVNVNGTPDYGAPARLDDARFLLPVLGVPPEAAADSGADPRRCRRAGHHEAGADDHAVAAGRQAAAGARAYRVAPHRCG